MSLTFAFFKVWNTVDTVSDSVLVFFKKSPWFSYYYYLSVVVE